MQASPAAPTRVRFGQRFSSSTKPLCKTTVYCQLKVACCSQIGRERKNQPGAGDGPVVEASESAAAAMAPKDGGLHPAVGTRRARSGKRSLCRGWFGGDKRATWLISRYLPHVVTCYENPGAAMRTVLVKSAKRFFCSSLDCNGKIRVCWRVGWSLLHRTFRVSEVKLYSHAWYRRWNSSVWGTEVSIDFGKLFNEVDPDAIFFCVFVFLRSCVVTAGETKSRLSGTSQA